MQCYVAVKKINITNLPLPFTTHIEIVVCTYFETTNLLNVFLSCSFPNPSQPTVDLDQLTRILVLCGTPSQETVGKITSEDVSFMFVDNLCRVFNV